VSETMSATAGKVVWFELPASDTKRAQEFYGRLFSWQFQPYEGQDYHLAGEAGGAIYGAPGQTGPSIYFGVDDIDAATARVRELGGQAGERQEIPNVGVYALCTDTEGNPFGVYQGGGEA
jgi:predicted enzyme related to lactoylglutathione lyase